MVGACPLSVILRASYGRGRVVAGDYQQDSDLSTRVVAATVTQIHRTASRQVWVIYMHNSLTKCTSQISKKACPKGFGNLVVGKGKELSQRFP
ncbi:hypothetical protein AVEN_139949-1 [Araneus ventricosus]|uniref:Uncharacterized protein n=1 Tax=Araneus ventricosus TaxID=182803 RepID=A0A4Y2SM48_ARAVE|nr:hypothetical protein AVEN_139949-1 [Araneus ventricosus]